MQFKKYVNNDSTLYNKPSIVNDNKIANTHLENQMPSWKIRAMELKNREFNIDKNYNDQFKYDTNELGFSHPENDSFMKFYDNGNIKAMSDKSTGLSINNQYKTFNIYGQGVNIKSQILNIKTSDGGLLINGYSLNPLLYLLCNTGSDENLMHNLTLDANIKYWKPLYNSDIDGYWEEKKIKIEPFLMTSERNDIYED